MADEIEGRPPSPADKILLDAYRQELVKQAERFDDLAKELVKLELAIPGIYAAALRFVMDKQIPIPFGWVGVAFGLWLIALLLTLTALFPAKWKVLEGAVRHVGAADGARGLSIEEFFRASARRKRRLLLGSAPCFFAGILVAAAAVFV